MGTGFGELRTLAVVTKVGLNAFQNDTCPANSVRIELPINILYLKEMVNRVLARR